MFRNIKTVSSPALSNLIATHMASALSLLVDGLSQLSRPPQNPDCFLHPLCPLVHYRTPASGRQLERLSKKTGLTVHLLASRDHVKAYKEVLSHAKTLYYSRLIGAQQSNPRTLFSTINRLLRPLDAPHPSGAPDLCSKFLDLFQETICDNPNRKFILDKGNDEGLKQEMIGTDWAQTLENKSASAQWEAIEEKS
ncbi:hypothetical protein F7725_001705 [Dissostichus mawsoni]|uniref:Uncharacterized protein n=1 Tax=Dissostichus mawsoni TaxID=36200 RepID=A0A7J5Y0E8_DISMA|nr:hypothetical protein F7725_001705 [Dissostichus mawsoni]